ncbi:MAG: hypothetical protein U0R17_03705 [Acidimicrobiia bacterium]
MDDLRAITPTPLYRYIRLDPPRNNAPEVLSDIARWLNEARRIIQPWDKEKLAAFLSTQTPTSLLDLTDLVARNVIGTEVLHQPGSLHPIHVLNQHDTFVWAGISGRDYEQAAQIFLNKIDSILNNSAHRDSSIDPSFAIAISEFQTYLHNVVDGTGRLSRALALMFWPEQFELNGDHIQRLLTGSTTVDDNYKSFSDPNISLGDIYNQIAFESFVDPATGKHFVLSVPSWSTIFSSLPQVGEFLDGATSKFDSQRIRYTFGLITHSYGINPYWDGISEAIIAKALSTPLNPIRQMPPFTDKERAQIIYNADIHECLIALKWSAASVEIATKAFDTINATNPQTIGDVVRIIANSCRETRLALMELGIESVFNKDYRVDFLDGNPSIADVLKAQYEDGVLWVLEGRTPSMQYDPLRLRTYPNGTSQSVDPIERVFRFPPRPGN